MTTIITDSPYYPSLLITPENTMDRDGSVTLTESGAVRRVPFDGGQAFFVEEGTTNLVPNPSFEIDSSGWTESGVPLAVTIARDTTQSIDGTASLRVDVDGEMSGQGTKVETNQVEVSPFEVSPSTTYTLSAFVKAPAGLGLIIGGTWRNGGVFAGDFGTEAFVGTGSWERVVNTRTVPSTPFDTLQLFVRTSSSGSATAFWVDGVQLEAKPYATPYAQGDMGDGYSWTGTPHASPSVREAASISAPLDTFTTAYIRHDGDSTVLTEPGTFGEHGLLSLDNGTLTVSTDRETPIAALVLYDTPLTEAEIARLDSIPTSELTWANIGSQVLRPQDTEVSVGEPLSGANHVEMTVYETDRDNVSREPLTYITDATPDWDIDRAGPKGRLNIASHRRVLRDGMWVATHARIVPEIGDIVDMQTGHFRLEMPSAEFDDSVGMDGGEKVLQNAVGSDIVDLLAKAQLPFTFYTPVGGHVMSDVKALIKLATVGRIGPNLVVNGGFENEGSGWIGPTNSGTGSPLPTHTWENTTITMAEGVRGWRPVFPSTTLVNGYVYVTQSVTLPANASRLFVSGMFFASSNHGGSLSVRFQDAAGVDMPSNTRINTASMYDTPEFPLSWVRQHAVGDIPEGAASFNIFAFVRYRATSGGGSASTWDDIQVRVVTQMPIPDNRINLPPSSAVATTRIQTTGGASIGTVAINADRLAAISHHAINATAEGVLTTYPSRSLGDSTAARTYGPNDYRFRGTKRIEPGPNNRFSMVTAVKESFEEGVAPLVVTVWNDDYNDPWSVHNIGNVGKEITVQDAVDADALEAAARAELARSTMQEELVIRVAPDPELTVYDVIEIEGGPEELQGRWLVQALSGVTPRAPYTEIHARRSRTSVGVTHG